jgi:N-acetylglucosamine kinase-like BadF-type ATPase
VRTFLGVDGGGTKTEFLLIDAAGRVLAARREGSAYYPEVGIDGLQMMIVRGIRATLAEAAVASADVAFACIGLPAYGEDSALLARLDAIASGVLPLLSYRCVNDMVCGWAGALACRDGINVVAGTGSIAYGEFESRVARAGGWGELFGDEGSAYWVAREALILFSRMSDGRAERAALYELVRAHFGVRADLDVCAAVYGPPPMTRSAFAAIAPIVSRAAAAGDAGARQILETAAGELAAIVNATRDQLAVPLQVALPVSYSGGMFRPDSQLRVVVENLLRRAGVVAHRRGRVVCRQARGSAAGTRSRGGAEAHARRGARGGVLMMTAIRAAMLLGLLAIAGGVRADAAYRTADFTQVRKFDAHVHANADDHVFLDVAARDGFELLSINVDYPDFPSLEQQARIAHRLRAADPAHFHFVTTFSMRGFGQAGWTADTIRHIDAEVAAGALGVKVWKNIGMVERNAQGRLIMLDDPGFDAVTAHLEERGIPLIAHQAEPKNCWLPLDQMTTENDRSYFRDHPEYYMYLHPEMPGYEDLMAARDRFVARHPKLKFVGAHMASLEWSVDRLAKFLDAYPNTTVDLAARMTQVQYQSNADYAKVRRFFIRYEDRLLYGTDLTAEPPNATERAQNPPTKEGQFAAEADAFWRSDWIYLATAGRQRIDAIKADVKGLALPKDVIDKIYYSNARRVFGLR